jgi:hypothetical protein
MKLCTKCNVVQSLDMFHRGRNPDGHRTWCKSCMSVYKKQYRLDNAEHINKTQKEYDVKKYPERKVYYQERYIRLKEKLTEQSRLWRLNNPHLNAKKSNKRRAAKIQRTPAWLTEDDHWIIEEAYELATLRTKLFGFPWHVDHIIPLQGKTVSGLHVPLNLQVIPGKENLIKHNKHEVQP